MDGWTTAGELKPGDLFETKAQIGARGDEYETGAGDLWVKVSDDNHSDSTNCRRLHDPRQRARVHNSSAARPLTPVAIAPALDPTLRGLLLAALAGGETAPLTDYLIEQMADPDAVRAVRENCARQCDDMARFYAGAGVGDGARYCARRIRSNAPGPFAGMNEADARRVFGPPWPT